MPHLGLEFSKETHGAVAASCELFLHHLEALRHQRERSEVGEGRLLHGVGRGRLKHDRLGEHHTIRLLTHQAGVHLAECEDHVAEAAHRVQLAIAHPVAEVVERLLDVLVAAVLLEQEVAFRRVLLGDEEGVGAVELAHPAVEHLDVLEHGADEHVVVLDLLLEHRGVAHLARRDLVGGAANRLLHGGDVPAELRRDGFVLDVVVEFGHQHGLAGDGPRGLLGGDGDLPGDKELIEGRHLETEILVVGGVVDAHAMGVEQVDEPLGVGREAPPLADCAAEFGGDDAAVAETLGRLAALNLDGHELLGREDDVVAPGVRLGDEVLHHQGVEVGAAALPAGDQRGLVEGGRTVLAGLELRPHGGTPLVVLHPLPIHRTDGARARKA